MFLNFIAITAEPPSVLGIEAGGVRLSMEAEGLPEGREGLFFSCVECAWEESQEFFFSGISIPGPEVQCGFSVVWMWVGWG